MAAQVEKHGSNVEFIIPLLLGTQFLEDGINSVKSICISLEITTISNMSMIFVVFEN
jgi:hypothetical protein